MSTNSPFFAWLLDEHAMTSLNADVANELKVTTEFVQIANAYHGEFIAPCLKRFPTLDDYKAAVRTARIAAVRVRQANLAAHEADYQKRRRTELKLQRATAPPPRPTRTQPSRCTASCSSTGSSKTRGIHK